MKTISSLSSRTTSGSCSSGTSCSSSPNSMLMLWSSNLVAFSKVFVTLVPASTATEGVSESRSDGARRARAKA